MSCLDPLNKIIYMREHLDFKEKVFIFNEAYGNFLFILRNKDINFEECIKKIEILIIIDEKRNKIKYKLKSNIFLQLKNILIENNKLEQLKEEGFNNGYKYYLYKKAYGKIIVIYKNYEDTNNDIRDNQDHINNIIKNINISIIIDNDKIFIKK